MKILTYSRPISFDVYEVDEIREILNEKGYEMDRVSAYLAWSDFSDSYCAGWLYPQDELVDSFIGWLQ